MKKTCLILCSLFLSYAAHAASIQLTPLTLLFRPTQQITNLDLRNQSNIDTSWQLNVLNWNENQGNMSYSPSNAFIVMPVIFSVAAQQHQMIRLARVTVDDKIETEKAYRLILRQISTRTTQPQNGENDELKLLLNVSLPIFIEPIKINRQYHAQINRSSHNEAVLTLKNTGNVHVLLLGYTIKNSKGQLCFSNKSQFIYVLAGQTWKTTLHLTSSCSENALTVEPIIQT